MSELQKHRSYSREEFEYVLGLTSPFMPFPEEWDFVQWKEDGPGTYKREELKKAINEYCYIIPVAFDPIRLLKVFSSVSKTTNYSRDIGGDAIRIVLADKLGKPIHVAFKRINRIRNWEWNLRLRISQALSFLGLDTECPKCNRKLFLRWNRQTRVRFLSCATWPKCDGSRNYVALNAALSDR